MKSVLVIPLGMILLCSCLAPEACAATINSTSCSLTDVQAAVNNATSGDMVLVPPGQCTWTSEVSIPDSKKLTLQGAGYNDTIITRAGTAFNMGESGSRITGFEFILPSGETTIRVQGIGWRIDHCRFTNTQNLSRVTISVSGVNRITLPTGLIDNNIFYWGRIAMSGMLTFEKANIEWAKPSILGTGDSVYIEDNSFYKLLGNVVDANRGASYVARFNSILGNTDICAHSLQADGERATRMWEVYKNIHTAETSVLDGVGMRGGTGIVWGNTFVGTFTSPIMMDNDRSFRSIPGAPGRCNGSSAWDGNELPNGWPCRDQIGRGPDAWLWTFENPYPPQASMPAYFFLNRHNGNIGKVTIINNCGDWIQADRDYYNEVPDFNGTSGVGAGLLSNRPTTCTPGVGYWATDQGNWNQIAGGDQGVLYKCTAPDTWTIYYTPYTYPHPLSMEGPSCHKSDSDCSGCVSDTELTNFIDRWKVSNVDVTLKELMEAIGLWKRGC